MKQLQTFLWGMRLTKNKEQQDIKAVVIIRIATNIILDYTNLLELMEDLVIGLLMY